MISLLNTPLLGQFVHKSVVTSEDCFSACAICTDGHYTVIYIFEPEYIACDMMYVGIVCTYVLFTPMDEILPQISFRQVFHHYHHLWCMLECVHTYILYIIVIS